MAALGIRTDELLRLSVAQYHAMRDAGILRASDMVELLDGLLVPKMTKRPPHALVCGLTSDALRAAVPPGYFVRDQDPVTTADSEPEPDIAVIRGERRDYADHHPGPGDAVLVVEVADDSLHRDRTTKAAVYARAGVACYWVVDLRGRAVEVYTEPSDGGYRQCVSRTVGSSLELKIDGSVVGRLPVADLLP